MNLSPFFHYSTQSGTSLPLRYLCNTPSMVVRLWLRCDRRDLFLAHAFSPLLLSSFSPINHHPITSLRVSDSTCNDDDHFGDDTKTAEEHDGIKRRAHMPPSVRFHRFPHLIRLLTDSQIRDDPKHQQTEPEPTKRASSGAHCSRRHTSTPSTTPGTKRHRVRIRMSRTGSTGSSCEIMGRNMTASTMHHNPRSPAPPVRSPPIFLLLSTSLALILPP